jgi:DNA replication protein DnaC
VSEDHPDFGKVHLCPNVDRWTLPAATRLGISRAEAENLAWSKVLDEGQALLAVEAVRKVIEHGRGWVYLYGGHGLAKTLILKIAVAEEIRLYRSFDCAYIRMAEILENLRGAYDADDPSTEAATRLDWWATIPLLAIDEFDRVRGTEYADEKRFVLMDRRYSEAIREYDEALRRSVTIIASNTDPMSLPSYLADRVLDGRFEVVRLTGESLRPGMTFDE